MGRRVGHVLVTSGSSCWSQVGRRVGHKWVVALVTSGSSCWSCLRGEKGSEADPSCSGSSRLLLWKVGPD